MDDFGDEPSNDEFEIEFTALPPDDEQPFLSKLRFPGSPVSRHGKSTSLLVNSPISPSFWFT